MSPTRMARLESAIRLALDFNQACNRQDVAAMMRLLSADCVFESATTVSRGQAAIRQLWEGFFAQPPGAQFAIEEIFGPGNRCVMRWKCPRGDYAHELGTVHGADIFKAGDDLISEYFTYIKGSFD